jgi:hypothetical protein
MEETKKTDIAETISQYAKLQAEIIKIKGIRSLSAGVSIFTMVVILGGVAAIAFIITAIGIALYISVKMNSYWIGFLTTGTGLFLFTFLIALFRKPLLTDPIRNRVIVHFIDSDPKNEQL